MKIIPGTEKYFLPGGTKGVVMVHGYTGTPLELRPLADFLAEQGFSVLGVRLPGHGTSWQDLSETTWPQWYQAVEEGVAELQKHCTSVSIVGLSLGALLAIKAAAELKIDSVVLMSTPIYVRDWRAPFLGILGHFIKKLKRRKYFENNVLRQHFDLSYGYLPTKPLPSLFELRDLCKSAYLPQVKVPALIVQSTVEHTVRAKSAKYIYDNIGSEHKELLWLSHSGHVVTLEAEHHLVEAAVYGFLKEHT
jgi:carboxylesterase